MIAALSAMRALRGHAFWPDSISPADSPFIDASLLSSHSRVTHGYLLALARANQGQLATLGHKLAAEVVPAGRSSLALL